MVRAVQCDTPIQILTRLPAPVSLVDGYNLPVRIDNDKGCGVADCPVDLGPNCTSPPPSPLAAVRLTRARQARRR